MTATEKKRQFVLQLSALNATDDEIANAMMLADKDGMFTDDEPAPINQKKTLPAIVVEKLRESLEEQSEAIKEPMIEAQRGRVTPVEGTLKAMGRVFDPAWFLAATYGGAALKTIEEYARQKNVKPETLVKNPQTLRSLMERENKVDVNKAQSDKPMTFGERLLWNVETALNLAAPVAGAVKIAKSITTPTKAIEKGVGKRVFEVAAGLSAKSAKADDYIAAIKAASNKAELSKIAKLYVDNNGTLANIADDLAEKLKELEARKIQAIKTVAGEAPRTPEMAGEKLSEAISGARREIGERYAEKEAELMQSSGAGAHYAFEQFGKAEGVVPKAGSLGTSINIRLKNMLKGIGDEIGFKIGDNPHYLAGKGTQPVSIKQQEALNEINKVVSGVGDFEELVRARRTVRDMISSWGKGADSFYEGAAKDRDWLKKTVYSKINEIYRSEAEKMIGGSAGVAFRQELENLDAFYSKASKAIDAIESGMSIKQGTRITSLRDRISWVSSKDMARVISASEHIDGLRPVVDELRRGFNESLMWEAIDAEGKLNPKKFIDTWRSISKEKPELLALMMGKEQIGNIEKAIDGYEKSVDALKYFTPKKSGGEMLSRLENRIGKITTEEAKELQFIDNLLGLQGDDSFFVKAVRFAQGKELGMSAKGEIANVPLHQTGKSLAMMQALEPIGGGVGAVLGAIIGKGAGEAAGGLGAGYIAGKSLKGIGLWLQSPAGNLWLYKALSSMPTMKQIAIRSVTGGALGAYVGAESGEEDKKLRNAIIGFVGGAAAMNVLPYALRKSGKMLKSETGAIYMPGEQSVKEGFIPALRDPESGKVYTGIGHKYILNQIARENPQAEKRLWGELFADNTGRYSKYVGFVDKSGNFIPREEAEKIVTNRMATQSLAQQFHGVGLIGGAGIASEMRDNDKKGSKSIKIKDYMKGN